MNESLFIGRSLTVLPSVDSTNNYAKEMLSKSKPIEGTAILAKEQYAGRGQMGNSWQAQPGMNLTLSVILYPDYLDADKQFYLNMAVSLGVKDFCESLLLDDAVRIKWPNDIYHADNKLGGILIENSISGGKLASSIIGIGLNINQTEFDPSAPNPTSLKRITGKDYNIEELAQRLFSFLEKYYLQLRQLHFNFLDRGYTDALYRYQQTHEYKKGEQTFKGEINGVAKDGKLIIHSNGKELRFAFKEVEYVIP
ncbi:MAG: biotin--[acetyl-CoA-carboxylase] ligase [Bacteroidetes bacterium]|nr:biotin--[acetyl-CoA-carboxylase] ligase [Bacteroidota bacterium]